MSKIDFSGLTNFIPEAVNDIKDLIKKEVFVSTDLTNLVTVVNEIKFGKKVGYLNKLTDIGKKGSATACALNEVTATVTTEEKTWTPRPFDTRIILCAEDVINSIAIKAMKAGVNRTDLTDTDYLDAFVDIMKVSLVEMYNRMIWFGDMGAARFNSSPAGFFSNTVDGSAFDLNLVNMQYGFFYRMGQAIAALPDNRYTLATYNNQATYALQKSTLTPAIALAAAEALTTDMPLDFNYEGVVFRCTRHFFNALRSNFQGFALESTKVNLEDGIDGLNINGVTFAPQKELDWNINRYMNSGTAWHNPHRVFANRQDNFLLGVPDVSQWGLFEMHYDKVSRKFYIDIKDEFDTMIMHNSQLVMAI